MVVACRALRPLAERTRTDMHRVLIQRVYRKCYRQGEGTYRG